MRRNHIVIACTIVGVLAVLHLPLVLYAQQKGDCTDFRNCQYTSQDLERALFPEEFRTRGVPTGPQPSPPPSERPVVTLNVFFEFNSDKILPKYYDDLNKLGEVLSRHPGYRFQIEGHTDSVGSEPYNQSLSEKRARSVKQYLVQNFTVASEHLRVAGYGENKPRTTNDTETGRSVNRRVEFVNLGK